MIERNRGRAGSSDRVILRLGAKGLYLSVRAFRTYGFWLAFGSGYVNRAGWRKG